MAKTIYVGSARNNESYGISGGAAGDQLQKDKVDYRGEVAQEPFYKHKLGWDIIRPISKDVADDLADLMVMACNNKNAGYDQPNRLKILNDGVNSKVKTSCDCSSLVRKCVIDATKKDPGNFHTGNAKVCLLKLDKFFTYVGAFKSLEETPIYDGDILVTRSKGHIVIVTSGNPRGKITAIVEGKKEDKVDVKYYKKYTGKSGSITPALYEIGERDVSLAHRARIAVANGFVKSVDQWTGTAQQNTKMLTVLKSGKLIKVS